MSVNLRFEVDTKPIIFGIYTHEDFHDKSCNRDGINEEKR
jgi:hypothetical protein